MTDMLRAEDRRLAAEVRAILRRPVDNQGEVS